MMRFTTPSGQGHHYKDRIFKRSFLVSFGIHAIIIAVAGSMTLFKISGTSYAPSYTVDLVAVPAPKPAAAPKPAPAVKPPPKEVRKKPEPPPVKKPAKEAEAPPPLENARKIQPSGGDEAARAKRRKKIEELEMEARRLYESFTSEEAVTAPDKVQPAEESVSDQPLTETTGGGKDTQTDIRFRAYYDRIWAQIRYSWVIPEGVTARVSLITVVGIRIATDGQIEDFWIEEKSGNEYYDQSALRAIKKANPLPPLPSGFNDTTLEVGINFRYPE